MEKIKNIFINKKNLFFILERGKFLMVFSSTFDETRNKSKTNIIHEKLK